MRKLTRILLATAILMLMLTLCCFGASALETVCEHDWYIDGNSYIPDCTEGGKLYYLCHNCEKGKTVTVEPKEHLYEYPDPSTFCRTQCFWLKCKNCTFYLESYITGTREHSLSWSYDNNATCTSDGTKTAYCDYCWEFVETVTDEGSALGHDHSGDWTVLLPATCSDRGVQIKNCQRCLNAIISEAIPAKEHVDADDNKVCDECSTKLSDTIVPDDTNPDEGATETPDEPEEPKKEANVFSFLTEFLNSIIDFFEKLFKL